MTDRYRTSVTTRRCRRARRYDVSKAADRNVAEYSADVLQNSERRLQPGGHRSEIVIASERALRAGVDDEAEQPGFVSEVRLLALAAVGPAGGDRGRGNAERSGPDHGAGAHIGDAGACFAVSFDGQPVEDAHCRKVAGRPGTGRSYLRRDRRIVETGPLSDQAERPGASNCRGRIERRGRFRFMPRQIANDQRGVASAGDQGNVADTEGTCADILREGFDVVDVHIDDVVDDRRRPMSAKHGHEVRTVQYCSAPAAADRIGRDRGQRH